MLLEGGRIGKLLTKNRFVMPPMATNFADEEGYVTEATIKHYKKRALGGFGLIITEITAICPRGKGLPKEAGLWKDEQIEGFSKLIKEIHDGGSKVFVQLHHAGRQTRSETIRGQRPEAPSPIPCPVIQCPPEAMSIERIWKVIDAFGDAAFRAKKAGADGVEIHGAHGYLIAQFMSGYANKRTDEFGGDLMGRMRFPLEIIKNVRHKVGDDFPISFRISYDEKVVGGRTLEETLQVAKILEKAGIDVLNVSMGVYASFAYISASPQLPHGFTRYQTRKIKKAVNIPVISVGRYDVPTAEEALLHDCADFIAFGRESLADPDIPNKVREGRENDIIKCISCNQACLNRVLKGQTVSCVCHSSVERRNNE